MQEPNAGQMPFQSKAMSTKGIEQVTPFQVLQTKVYPVLNEVILKLIDHIVKSHQVTKHEQRLKKKKVVDELQKKYIQRDIERAEMGSDYEESDDEEYCKILTMDKATVNNLIRKRIAKHKSKPLDDQSDHQIDSNVFDPIAFIVEQLKIYHKK